MLTEKDKLEEELKFLEESFESDVITKEEYEAAKQRIESRLKELGQKKEKPGIKVEEIKHEEIGKEELRKQPGEGQKKLEEVKVEDKKAEEKVREEKPTEEISEEKPAEEIKEEALKEEKPEIPEEEIKINKKALAYVAVILILVVGSWYFFFSGPVTPDISFNPVDKSAALIACSSDNECGKEGKIGICINPGKENAECEYIEDVKIKLTILNSKECFNCNSGRVISILNGFYPNLDIEMIDFETEQGKETAEKFNIYALPAYIFNSSFEEAYNYDKLSSSFNEAYDSFVMKNTVANANYYIGREEIPKKLDLFLMQDQAASLKAEENLKEFLETFDVDFEKHAANDEIAKELGINTFPTFLVNNKIKFSGVQPADKIKENFCYVNKLDECSLELSKSLV